MMQYDLEDRLIRFSLEVLNLCKSIPNSYVGVYLSEQITRSSISSALNYGESQGAESNKDFIHKLKLVLKELRESKVNLKIMRAGKIAKDQQLLNKVLNECDELVAITYSSIKSAIKNAES